MESFIWFLGVVVAALVGEEILGLSYQLSRVIILQAAKNVPDASRERFIEETLSELADIRGPLSRMWNAVDYFWVTRHLRSHNGNPGSSDLATEGASIPLISEAGESRDSSGRGIAEIIERILAALIILGLLILLIILALPVPSVR